MRTGHGGPRKGAGRKSCRRPIVHHVRRDRFDKPTPALVTVRVREGLPSLRAPRIVAALRQSFAAVCVRDGFRLVHYSIQRDHIHMIVEAGDQSALGRGMKSIVARIALTTNRLLGRRGPVMAGRYHVRHLCSPRQVHRALRYVLLNVRKHEFARTQRAGPARIDKASSGRWFDGWKERPVQPPAAPRDVAPPTTWLLTRGWRRHGRISLSAVPGAGT